MPRIHWTHLVWTSVLLAMSNNLYAVDGVVLIDQNRALAGNVTPGDEPGFPVTISVAGSYRLSGNLTVPDVQTTAVYITADFVTLDLNGFSIIGPNVCTPNPTTCAFTSGGIGVHAAELTPNSVPRNGIRVMNGIVRGMGFHGIRLPGKGTAAERIHAYGNGGPGIFARMVTDSSAFLNGGSFGIAGNIVRGSTAAENRSTGISVSHGGVASGNSSYNNGGAGITIIAGTVSWNGVYNNGTFAIDATCPSAIIGNTAANPSSPNQAGLIRRNGGTCYLADNSL